MKKYVLTYAAWYAGLMILIALITYGLDINGSFDMVAALASSFAAAASFVKDQQRQPKLSERKAYALGALGISFLVSFVLVLLASFFIFSEKERQWLFNTLFSLSSIWVICFVIVLLVISAIYYLAIRWSFSWYSKRLVIQNGWRLNKEN